MIWMLLKSGDRGKEGKEGKEGSGRRIATCGVGVHEGVWRKSIRGMDKWIAPRWGSWGRGGKEIPGKHQVPT